MPAAIKSRQPETSHREDIASLPMIPEAQDVLLVEDDQSTRKLIIAVLREWGYAVQPVSTGDAAWEVLEGNSPPRLVLLDWLLPGLDGVEICRRLKAEETRPLVYVIMLSCKTAQEELAEALDAGADDFIKKPCDLRELKSRLNAGRRIVTYDAAMREQTAKIQSYTEELEEVTTQLENLAEERARSLVHADRMVTLGTLSAGIAHEINNPAAFIAGNAATIDKFWQTIEPLLREGHASAYPKVQFVLDEFPAAVAGMRTGVERITKIVNALKGYARQSPEARGKCSIKDCVETALQLCRNKLKYHVTVEQDIPDTLPSVVADRQQIEQVLVNLFTNAADATEDCVPGRLEISAWGDGDAVCLRCRDNGPGLLPRSREDVWKPFFTTKAPGKGTGLGLSIAQRIVREHGGTITAENAPEGGAAFTMRLPRGEQHPKPLSAASADVRDESPTDSN